MRRLLCVCGQQRFDREHVLSLLSVTPVPVDELITQSGLSVAAMQTILLELDLGGQLEWASGQLVSLRS